MAFGGKGKILQNQSNGKIVSGCNDKIFHVSGKELPFPLAVATRWKTKSFVPKPLNLINN
jgi:hypothetical protein